MSWRTCQKGYEFALFARLQASLPMLLDREDLQNLTTKTTPEGIRAELAKTFALPFRSSVSVFWPLPVIQPSMH